MPERDVIEATAKADAGQLLAQFFRLAENWGLTSKQLVIDTQLAATTLLFWRTRPDKMPKLNTFLQALRGLGYTLKIERLPSHQDEPMKVRDLLMTNQEIELLDALTAVVQKSGGKVVLSQFDLSVIRGSELWISHNSPKGITYEVKPK